jgi:hypothetical protein
MWLDNVISLRHYVKWNIKFRTGSYFPYINKTQDTKLGWVFKYTVRVEFWRGKSFVFGGGCERVATIRVDPGK